MRNIKLEYQVKKMILSEKFGQLFKAFHNFKKNQSYDQNRNLQLDNTEFNKNMLETLFQEINETLQFHFYGLFKDVMRIQLFLNIRNLFGSFRNQLTIDFFNKTMIQITLYFVIWLINSIQKRQILHYHIISIINLEYEQQIGELFIVELQLEAYQIQRQLKTQIMNKRFLIIQRILIIIQLNTFVWQYQNFQVYNKITSPQKSQL
ncbi:unnamed protein product [Paramecium sonneborni]|uniref:Uncharacterized protein n=1 Tax=Paramecium sonneborni TaxID=65129 RepID=A0A8S1RH72_9CILI|nr:unnamed protein product [Paramecium sonneborni]